MDALDLLKMSLLDLHAHLMEHEIPLILGGGYGLFLKQLHLRAENVPTLFEVEMWPEARSTSDLDLFLRAEVVTDPERMRVSPDRIEVAADKRWARLGGAAITASPRRYRRVSSAGTAAESSRLAGSLAKAFMVIRSSSGGIETCRNVRLRPLASAELAGSSNRRGHDWPNGEWAFEVLLSRWVAGNCPGARGCRREAVTMLPGNAKPVSQLGGKVGIGQRHQHHGNANLGHPVRCQKRAALAFKVCGELDVT
jgi:hypothetical protein